MSLGETGQTLGQHRLQTVHELLHGTAFQLAPAGALTLLNQSRNSAQRFLHKLVELLVLLVITQIRHAQAQLPPARLATYISGRTMRMGTPVDRQKTLSFCGKKVAGLKDALEVIRGYRYAVLRVSDLRYETAILP